MKEYARSKKLDKEASSGKPGVALGNVETKEEEQWGEQGDWQWEDITAVSGGTSKGKVKTKGKCKDNSKGEGKDGGKGGKGAGKSTEVATDGKGNRYPVGELSVWRKAFHVEVSSVERKAREQWQSKQRSYLCAL